MLQLAGQHIHHAFGGKLGFLVTVSAIGADRRGVGVNGVAGQVTVLEFIWSSGVMGGSHGDIDRRICISTAGVQDGRS